MKTELQAPKIPFRNSGIKASALLEWVQNTAAFLFDDLKDEGAKAPFRYVSTLNEAISNPNIDENLYAYYELCIASHFATVGTFIPTDVDLAIRSKLWSFIRNEADFELLWKLVQEFATWDESLVSRRVIRLDQKRYLSGHQGEWFTIAMAAYGKAKKEGFKSLPDVRVAIEDEVKNQEKCLSELEVQFLEKRDVESMERYLGGVAAVVHNLGDLDRMFELWSIDETDILKGRVFRLGHEDSLKPVAVFKRAGDLYQKFLANENHRHFALRTPKALRKRNCYLLNYGPFLDTWGKNLVVQGYFTGDLDEGEMRDILEALISGWKKLNATSIYHSQGYSRALRGIAETLGKEQGYKKGKEKIELLLSPALAKSFLEGGLQTLMSVSKAEFERKWLTRILAQLEPSE